MTAPPKVLSLPQLGAVVAGNALEFYDFLTFGFFAVQIGAVFFPGHDATGRLLLTLATFGVGFLTRPLGGAVIGPLGDRLGRKPAMLFSFGLMGLSIVGLALTPSYASIGWYAPLLVVLFRLLQGFALGGEVGPTTAFLMESAPLHRRGLYVSLQNATQYFSTLCAGLVGLALANWLSPQDLTAWGWRVAFLLGAAVVPFALIMRKNLPETLPQTVQAETQRQRLSRPQLWLGLLGLCTLASLTIATYTMNYMGTFGMHSLGIPASKAFGATVAVGVCATAGALLGGFLSDRLGRKPVMIGGSLLLLLLGLPCFAVMSQVKSVFALLAGSGLMAVATGLYAPAILVGLSESLPTSLRAGSLGILYALAISCFGGSAQFVVTWLIDVTGSPLAPAWYMSGAVLLGLAGMIGMRETAPIKLDR
ncbi:MAG TPA: MFS transporter [Rhizomicrobium sp.]|nr:MFS transporter [Rhizomicrobium sp.]